MNIIKIHNSYILYRKSYGIINDYYLYLVELIQQFLKGNSHISVNINITNGYNYNFNNFNKLINIGINYEHILVLPGGRDIAPETKYGNVKYNEEINYLIRIDNYNNLHKNDIIIDYSMPNIINVRSNNTYNSFSKKHNYIAPMLYIPSFSKENRTISTLTTFININEPRRLELLTNINNMKIEHINVRDCFDKNDLQCLYQKTKILINIHQTEHHHTFEELRCLPALLCGVIIISEISPLKEQIPYHNMIIWCDYKDILSKTKEVMNNYDYYYNLIFNKNNNITELNDLNSNNINALLLSNIRTE